MLITPVKPVWSFDSYSYFERNCNYAFIKSAPIKVIDWYLIIVLINIQSIHPSDNGSLFIFQPHPNGYHELPQTPQFYTPPVEPYTPPHVGPSYPSYYDNTLGYGDTKYLDIPQDLRDQRLLADREEQRILSAAKDKEKPSFAPAGGLPPTSLAPISTHFGVPQTSFGAPSPHFGSPKPTARPFRFPDTSSFFSPSPTPPPPQNELYVPFSPTHSPSIIEKHFGPPKKTLSQSSSSSRFGSNRPSPQPFHHSQVPHPHFQNPPRPPSSGFLPPSSPGRKFDFFSTPRKVPLGSYYNEF